MEFFLGAGKRKRTAKSFVILHSLIHSFIQQIQYLLKATYLSPGVTDGNIAGNKPHTVPALIRLSVQQESQAVNQ